jgi:hypothetical protein
LQHLAANFVLGYHGCDSAVAERLLCGDPFRASQNDYDRLGWGIYFWEANPQRGLDFANEAASRKDRKIRDPAVVGAVIDLGECLDLMSKAAIDMVRTAHLSLVDTLKKAGKPLPTNEDKLRRQLDCAVIQHLHTIYEESGDRIDTVRGVFTEGNPVYPGSAFDEKTHIQIAVRNPDCIKGVFRVPRAQLKKWRGR